MKFYIRHSDGANVEFEANSRKYAVQKARRIAENLGLENAELFGWHQLWAGDPAAGMEAGYMSVTWEGWQSEACL